MNIFHPGVNVREEKAREERTFFFPPRWNAAAWENSFSVHIVEEGEWKQHGMNGVL